jgi:hypothetical protein
MEPKKEKIFADGMMFKRKNEKAPAFVKGHVSVKVEDFTKFIARHKDAKGWVNLDLKESQGGKLYFELNTWKPKEIVPANTVDAINPNDIPF